MNGAEQANLNNQMKSLEYRLDRIIKLLEKLVAEKELRPQP
jgi:hypothetical protein